MSYTDATGAQRYALNAAATKLAAVTAPARNSLQLPGITGHADVDAAAAQAVTALSDAGYGTTLPDDAVTVLDGDTVNVQNSQGDNIEAADSVAEVVDGALTVKLPATVGAVQNGSDLVIGGVTYTFTVAAGIITNITTSP